MACDYSTILAAEREGEVRQLTLLHTLLTIVEFWRGQGRGHGVVMLCRRIYRFVVSLECTLEHTPCV